MNEQRAAMADHRKAQNVKQTNETAHQRRSVAPISQEWVGVEPFDLTTLQRSVANPGLARPADILGLQHAYGNQAVSRLLANPASRLSCPAIQAKLVVGPVGDRYEQEADRVAEQVMSMPNPQAVSSQRSAVSGQLPLQRQAPEEEEEVQTKPLAASITPLVQRQAEEEEEVQAKPLAQRQDIPEEEGLQAKPLLQRQEVPEEEELQMKPALQPFDKLGTRHQADGSFEASNRLEQRLASRKGGGSPLPDAVRAFMEPRFGADFGGVRVHTGAKAAQMNKELSAQAFTHGQDIYLGEGKYNPGSTAGKRLLTHELTHVVQQTGGGQSNPRLQRFAITDDPINWGEANSAWYSSTGLTGVIFVATGADRSGDQLVVKGCSDPPGPTVFAEVLHQAVAEVGIPRTKYLGKAEANTALKSRLIAIGQNQEGRKTTFQEELEFMAFGGGKHIYVMGKVAGRNFEDLFKRSPQEAVNKLKNPNYMQVLGKVHAVDLFLGNPDRLSAPANLGNWMTEGDNVAVIDNVYDKDLLSKFAEDFDPLSSQTAGTTVAELASKPTIDANAKESIRGLKKALGWLATECDAEAQHVLSSVTENDWKGITGDFAAGMVGGRDELITKWSQANALRQKFGEIARQLPGGTEAPHFQARNVEARLAYVALGGPDYTRWREALNAIPQFDPGFGQYQTFFPTAAGKLSQLGKLERWAGRRGTKLFGTSQEKAQLDLLKRAAIVKKAARRGNITPQQIQAGLQLGSGDRRIEKARFLAFCSKVESALRTRKETTEVANEGLTGRIVQIAPTGKLSSALGAQFLVAPALQARTALVKILVRFQFLVGQLRNRLTRSDRDLPTRLYDGIDHLEDTYISFQKAVSGAQKKVESGGE